MFLARTPHGYHDIDQIDAELRKAGFSAVEIVTLQERSDAASARDPAVAYCQGTPLRNESKLATRTPCSPSPTDVPRRLQGRMDTGRFQARSGGMSSWQGDEACLFCKCSLQPDGDLR
jgi:hypothetical protein